MTDHIEFIPMSQKRPIYGQPVLIKIKGIVQHITYTLDGADDTRDWFEPYLFDHDDEMKLWWNKADEWAALPNWEG
jgi:hypothetical protein